MQVNNEEVNKMYDFVTYLLHVWTHQPTTSSCGTRARRTTGLQDTHI